MALKKGYKQLLDEANAEVTTLQVDDLKAKASDSNVVVVDIRDIRERQREGFIPGSIHAPRGMLEFWVDPESPYHREIFASGKSLVFHCASGWRSALAAKAVQDMGLDGVSHLGGGFSAWRDQGGETLKTDDGREPKS